MRVSIIVVNYICIIFASHKDVTKSEVYESICITYGSGIFYVFGAFAYLK